MGGAASESVPVFEVWCWCGFENGSPPGNSRSRSMGRKTHAAATGGGFGDVKFCGARKFFFFLWFSWTREREREKKDPKPGNRAKGLGRPSYQASCLDGGDAARYLGGVVARMAMSSSQDSRHVCDRVGIGRWLLVSFSRIPYTKNKIEGKSFCRRGKLSRRDETAKKRGESRQIGRTESQSRGIFFGLVSDASPCRKAV